MSKDKEQYHKIRESLLQEALTLKAKMQGTIPALVQYKDILVKEQEGIDTTIITPMVLARRAALKEEIEYTQGLISHGALVEAELLELQRFIVRHAHRG